MQHRVIGIPPDRLYSRLTHLLAAGWRLHHESPALLAIKLRNRELDASFLSAIEYGRDSSEYQIIPASVLSSDSATDTITLHFRQGVHTISRLAVDPAYPTEIILARIILGEHFDVIPQIVPAVGSPGEMLSRADAVLCVGNASQEFSPDHENRLDLVEQWSDLTGLPYVHSFCCFREGELSGVELETLAGALGDPGEGKSNGGTQVRNYEDEFSYSLTGDAQASLREFFHYAYYHGALPDIPELNFPGADHASRDGDPPIAG